MPKSTKRYIKSATTAESNHELLGGTARSSYISKMIDEGFHPLQVAELAGNSPQTIYRYYYTISDKEKMKEKMNDIFSS